MKKVFLILALSQIIFIGKLFAQKPIYSIKNIQAHLFYNLDNDSDTSKYAGTLSENIIDKKDFALWNTIIGEGSAQAPSDQLFVIIEILGKGSTNDERTLRVTCKSNEKVAIKQETKFSIFTINNKYCYAMILNDVGCAEVEIVAEIINSKTTKVESSLSKIIDFECGE
jgi:hypothetical protein